MYFRKMKPSLGVLALFLCGLSPVASQAPSRQPSVINMECAASDCPLLSGPPQTAGMRSGFVRLKPGQTVGWHSTDKNEESLVILHGSGTALIEGSRNLAFKAPQLVYIPPETRHNVQNTGSETLEYVYVVAPAKEFVPPKP
jgi:mannose-6-phosphate isomerase-like protein (cupin superfamily)